MQLALAFANGSPRLFAAASAARRASYCFAYSGFSAGAPAGGGANFGSAPRAPRYGPQAPVKSGLFVDCAPSGSGVMKAADSPTAITKSVRPQFIGLPPLPAAPALGQDHSPEPARRAMSPGRATHLVCRLS